MVVSVGVKVSGTGGVRVGGGMFARVWRQWIWGAVRTMCGAVGFVKVGIVAGAPFEKGAPFERTIGVSPVAPQGTVVISWVGLSAVGGAVCCCRAWSMVAKSRFHAV